MQFLVGDLVAMGHKYHPQLSINSVGVVIDVHMEVKKLIYDPILWLKHPDEEIIDKRLISWGCRCY